MLRGTGSLRWLLQPGTAAGRSCQPRTCARLSLDTREKSVCGETSSDLTCG